MPPGCGGLSGVVLREPRRLLRLVVVLRLLLQVVVVRVHRVGGRPFGPSRGPVSLGPGPSPRGPRELPLDSGRRTVGSPVSLADPVPLTTVKNSFRG